MTDKLDLRQLYRYTKIYTNTNDANINKYVGPTYCRAKMYSSRVACW